MLFEAMNLRSSHGVVSLATSPDAQTWTYQQVVLQEPFHLSYPYVFEQGGEYYMVPESCRIGAVRLYHADPFPYRWRLVDTLINLPLADSSVVHFRAVGGCWEHKRIGGFTSFTPINCPDHGPNIQKVP